MEKAVNIDDLNWVFPFHNLNHDLRQRFKPVHPAFFQWPQQVSWRIKMDSGIS